jgi:secreted trypsin-like serine protease
MKYKEFLKIFVPICVVLVATIMIYVAFFVSSAEPLCGDKPESSEIVLDGNQTRINSWPWFVALRFKPTNAFFCAGSLISDRYVITSE